MAWESMLVDCLGLIFSRLPLEERLTTLPLVCKSWLRTCLEEPRCWWYVDLEPWFLGRLQQDYWWEFECGAKVDHVVRAVVDRSRGLLRELNASHCCDASVDYLARRCRFLVGLGVPCSIELSDAAVTVVATLCPLLRRVDLSDCHNVSSHGLEVLGRGCRNLVELKRNMPRNRDLVEAGYRLPVADEEAGAVARAMPGLRRLEMRWTTLSREGLALLVRSLPRLEHLDVSHCIGGATV